ncbi:hypothetical protein [Nonomuraea sp. NPDC001023]|uniref:hypothetical protein n=1 Tax=unclassified Nonomuraea TaxID=2593643 RepID=UPI00331BB235
MNSFLMLALVALGVLLATNRRELGNARTLSEMWEPARANGWGRGTALTVAGLFVFALLLAASLGLVALAVATKTVQGVGFVAGIVHEHLRDLLNPPLPIGRVETA